MKKTEVKTNQLLELYESLYGALAGQPSRQRNANLDQLAERLSHAAHRGDKPWTRRYLQSILAGAESFRVTPEMERAIVAVAAAELDGGHPLAALLKKIVAYSVNGHVRPGSILLGQSKRCQGCGALIVPNVPWRKYCCDKCRERTTKNAD